MTDSILNQFDVTLDSDKISVRSGHGEGAEAIRDGHFASADSLIADLNIQPFELKTQKKLGLWLYRELPIKPDDVWEDELLVFTITDRLVWGHLPWELVFDGSKFLLERKGARFQVFTKTKLPGLEARPLGAIDQLKVALITKGSTVVEKCEEIISWFGESPSLYLLQNKEPREVREDLRGIQPDVVLMDAISSSLLTTSAMLGETEKLSVSESESAEPNAWDDSLPNWNEATAHYLFAGAAPPLILAPSNEEFALDALVEGADRVVLCSRYQIDDNDYYDFALEFLKALTPANEPDKMLDKASDKALDMLFMNAVTAWQERQSSDLRIPLIYSRFPYSESETGDGFNDEKRRPASNPWDEATGYKKSAIQTKAKYPHIVEHPTPRSSSLPAPDLRTATQLSSYRSDIAATTDQLGVNSDVANLCQVVMAKQWKPPLSIGLFGDWGSGKTSFINLMQHMIKATADRARGTKDSAFVSNVIQIEFNAWHYLDANLWANLVVRILDGIHTAVFEPEQGDEQGDEYKQIIAHFHVLQEEIEKSEVRQRRLETDVGNINTNLGKKREEQNTKTGLINTLRTALGDSDNAIAKEVEAVKEKLGEATEKLGLNHEANLTETQVQAQQFMQTGARIRKAWRDMSKDKLWWLVLPLAAVLFWIGTGQLKELSIADNAITAVSTLITLFVSWAKSLYPQLKEINAGLDAIQTARAKVENLRGGWLAAKQEQLSDLESQRTAALREISKLETRRSDIDKEHQQLIDRLEQLRQGRGLEDFLLDRAGSVDYQEQLGIIALIHQDMKELQRKLRAGLQVTVDGNTETRQYDRVILYIDDLDRCTPARVVEVLQALHLLLSMPLFVVVVAADPRWLLQCLLTHYQDLLHEGLNIGTTEWAVTPQNYLEKIFQIPYTLPPMASRDFPNYVTNLFSKEDVTPDADETEIHYRELQNEVEFLEITTDGMQQQIPLQEMAVTTVDTRPTNENNESAETSVEAKTAPPEPLPDTKELQQKQKELAEKRSMLRQARRKLKTKQRQALAQLPTFETNPKALSVTDPEQNFVTALLPLLTTPRTTKRLLNVYRLIRVSLSPEGIKTFEKKEHQAVLVLLAVMYSYPSIAPAFFTGLRYAKENTIFDYAEQTSLQSKNGEWKRLSRGMSKVKAVQDINVYRRWIDVVGRFSFQVGHELARDQS